MVYYKSCAILHKFITFLNCEVFPTALKNDESLNTKIRQLYAIVNDLEQQFPGRHFTPDGHLVGSIGEVIAASTYDLELLPASYETHDAITPNGKMVQIKATQKDRVSLYGEPNFLIVLKILPDGSTIELFNGPGKQVWDSAGPLQKNGQRSISTAKLKNIMSSVVKTDQISLKP